MVRMTFVFGILIVLHIVGFGAVFGSVMAQLPNVKRGTARIMNGVIHGISTLFATGLILVAMTYMVGLQPDNLKIAAKLVVLIVLTVIVLLHRKRASVSGGVLGAIAGLSVLNVAIAVLWR